MEFQTKLSKRKLRIRFWTNSLKSFLEDVKELPVSLKLRHWEKVIKFEKNLLLRKRQNKIEIFSKNFDLFRKPELYFAHLKIPLCLVLS